MTTTYTSGPWHINTHGHLELNGNDTGTAAAEFSDGALNYEEALANLTLAAAAPDLLEAVKAMMEPYAGIQGEFFAPETQRRLHLARTAIAKAEGKPL